ncbi:hypothetical protein GPECTOR_5g463 [Gonium pectorale]|uniref:Uncharacterized protein n=1 Tax=Gonium pectorale TaxID=33097 RepID=A0A150GX55_GONPE|nr:hypothetical protein GPECTOR_5g463 [Gonium pectorale]|eukprot:KXZ54385.1 hypothetical protein GPECTOR_5g463 [Gonium pectorale]
MEDDPTGRLLSVVGSPPRRRKLFADSPDGPLPATTGRIVARIAAARHWRRPLAHRVLRRYLHLFDEHATAYFFRHVPSLQPPLSPDAASDGRHHGQYWRRGGGRPDRELSGFRRMVLAVCCWAVPRLQSFGPRALACMAAGLGRMGIRHGPTAAAWEAASAPQLCRMRPHQLVAALEGWARLSAGLGEGMGAGAEWAGPSSGRLPSSAWGRSALEAVASALPNCDCGQLGRLLQSAASAADGGAPAATLLREAAAALGCLAALVPRGGLRYAAEREEGSVQAIADALGLRVRPPDQEPGQEPGEAAASEAVAAAEPGRAGGRNPRRGLGAPRAGCGVGGLDAPGLTLAETAAAETFFAAAGWEVLDAA